MTSAESTAWTQMLVVLIPVVVTAILTIYNAVTNRKHSVAIAEVKHEVNSTAKELRESNARLIRELNEQKIIVSRQNDASVARDARDAAVSEASAKGIMDH